ncbi:MAG: GGDEF domain-containing phosphodiesterase [Sphingopyxis sp.]|jgi:EAL domain-containing protein (putative c-di-GMP-specific phosphodiesterase class I)|uniref:Diguanylate cyclase n=1 Tax=Sphingopyxis terrae subsp. terrae NBRC 15098 TaxID=1219058 RepID=A0A142VUT6_9SPHN|nr:MULTISPECIES: GGDEF domain-containing phosphodiesterase [Sphingopyxis]AMU93057.1 diguanylate cyclase [Sphingopyxis terrae subsp. terrae NBRC 15098]QXF12761.1 EAL domain-containing protein [Sphingopyxis terrae subsp. terrae]
MNRTVDTNAQSVRHLENLHGRHGADAGVILVQVDQLARINHSAGTETGNALLDEVARRLETFAADEFGHGSFVGRLEGPRFLIVPAVPLSLGALRAQERALHVALAEPMVGDPNGRLAIRIVTALITRDEPVEEQLRAAADQLARPASARDGVMVKSALANDEVAIFYQPQYEVATGAMIGVEALLRWQHPELGLLGAGPLVTAARAARMERELTEHAHRVALAEIAGWPRALGKLRVSLNITAADLGDPDFADRFAAMVKATGVDPDRLTLELTEQAMLSDPASAAAQLAQIRALGCAIAIDDFGTGYSSLSLLARLPIDYLKIDNGFTRTIDGSDRDRIVVRAIVDLARALGLLVVAEGVENERQLERLRELGVATWQGFLKSGPVPGSELPGLME